MKKKVKVIISAIMIAIFITWIILKHNYDNFTIKPLTIKKIEIEKWDNLTKLTKKLCLEKNISCLNLKIYSFLHKQNIIKPWIYSFSWSKIWDIFLQFKKWPIKKYIKFTILPWWTKYDIKIYIEKISNKKIADKFLKLVNDSHFINNLNYPFLKDFPNLKSLEGFLYPDTYFFKQSDIKSILFPELLIKTTLKNFQKKWNTLQCNVNCNPYKLTNYQNLIIASIIEKEASKNKNKPLIADILIRRYLHHWKLWADWTLCYGLKVSSSNCQKYLTYKYLNDDTNIYNTRANTSLPPTPVSNPTIQTIKATLFPKKNNYWYYLHWKNGEIHFAKNIKEHILNKNMYLK